MKRRTALDLEREYDQQVKQARARLAGLPDPEERARIAAELLTDEADTLVVRLVRGQYAQARGLPAAHLAAWREEAVRLAAQLPPSFAQFRLEVTRQWLDAQHDLDRARRQAARLAEQLAAYHGLGGWLHRLLERGRVRDLRRQLAAARRAQERALARVDEAHLRFRVITQRDQEREDILRRAPEMSLRIARGIAAHAVLLERAREQERSLTQVVTRITVRQQPPSHETVAGRAQGRDQ